MDAASGRRLHCVLQVLLVALLRRFQPKAVTSFELLSLAVPLPDVLSSWTVTSLPLPCTLLTMLSFFFS